MNSIKILSHDDIKSLGGDDMKLAIQTMEEVFVCHAKKDYVLPNKSVLRWGDYDSESTIGRINSMPAWIGGSFNATGIKWISSSPQNPDKYNLSRSSGVIVLNDAKTLYPIAFLDAMLLSAMRTGANSGVAAKYLASPKSEVLGLIGAGLQNRTQLLAMVEVLPNLKQVNLTDLNLERAKIFAEEMEALTNLSITVIPDAETVVKTSDVFITATVTKTPIIKKEWIRPGQLYLHVGSHECEFSVISAADKVVVDDWEELKHRGVESISIMYSEGKFDPKNIHAELGEIVISEKQGRSDDSEFIYFNSVGMGIQDVALASVIYNNSLKKNIGENISLFE